MSEDGIDAVGEVHVRPLIKLQVKSYHVYVIPLEEFVVRSRGTASRT